MLTFSVNNQNKEFIAIPTTNKLTDVVLKPESKKIIFPASNDGKNETFNWSSDGVSITSNDDVIFRILTSSPIKHVEVKKGEVKNAIVFRCENDTTLIIFWDTEGFSIPVVNMVLIDHEERKYRFL